MKIRQSIIFFAAVLMVLAVIAILMPDGGIKIGEHTYGFAKLSSLFNFKKEDHQQDALQRMQEMEDQLQQTEEEVPLTAEEKEKLEQEGRQHEADLQFLATMSKNPAQIYMPNNNVHYLDCLFGQLDSCMSKGELIHIIHYGDSQIEADRITSYIRRRLQDKFGGMGPGLLPVVQPIHSYTVRQSNSGNMEHFLADGTLQLKASNQRYGALAQFATFDGKANFAIRSKLDKHNGFNNIRLFVGNTSDGFKASRKVGNKDEETKVIDKASMAASVISWKLSHDIKETTIDLEGKGELYAVALDGQAGVAVDNVPMRGSRGTFFSKMEQSLFAYMHQQLNTKLIILEFGGNAMPLINNTEDVQAYQQLMAIQIKWIKQACPNIPIILIGPSDMGIKIDGEIQTRPFLEENIKAMQKTALDNGIAYWNMFEVMGGHNAMIDWVNQRPQLAMSDYTHFSNKGAERIAKVFVESLKNYYDYYEENKQKASDSAVSATKDSVTAKPSK